MGNDRLVAKSMLGRGLVAWWAACGASGCVWDPPVLPEAPGGSTGQEPTTGQGPTTGQEPTTGQGPTTSDGATTSQASTTSEGPTGPLAECGNGDVEAAEDCDGANLQGATCEDLGQAPGFLACTEQCAFDVSGCVPEGMVLVPGGEFEMGSEEEDSDEQPIRQVNVDTFWIDETEVTVAEYAECVDAGDCDAPPTGPSYNYGVVGREEHPINGVDWSGAAAYCASVEGGGVKRLPTEAEWEKAARGVDGLRYPWGDAPAPSCTLVVMSEGGDGCGVGSTWEVGSKPLSVSPYGALDMAGNVYEWVNDWYGDYVADETDNPTGPTGGDYRVLRGGAWSFGDPYYFRAANRGFYDATDDDAYVGFRCAWTPPAAP